MRKPGTLRKSVWKIHFTQIRFGKYTLVIAFRKYITLRGLQKLCNSPESLDRLIQRHWHSGNLCYLMADQRTNLLTGVDASKNILKAIPAKTISQFAEAGLIVATANMCVTNATNMCVSAFSPEKAARC